QRGIGGPGWTPGPLLYQVEGVQAGTQLVAHQQVREGVVLGGVRLLARGGAGRGYELEGSQECRCSATGLGEGQRPGRGDGALPGGLVAVDRGTTDGGTSGDHIGRPGQG